MRWSRMRTYTLITTVVCIGICTTMYISSVAYTGTFSAPEEFWLLIFAAVVAAVGYIGAHIRDQIVDAVRANAQTLEDLPLHITDYGDRREIAGHKLVQRVTDAQRHRLHTVD